MHRTYRILIADGNWTHAQAIERQLQASGAHFQVLANVASASALEAEIAKYEGDTPVDVVLLNPDIGGFNVALVQDLLYHPSHPVAVIGLLPPLESRANDLYAAGMAGHVTLPVDPAQGRRLLELIPDAVMKAQAKRDTEVFVPLAPTLATISALQWQRMTIALYGTGGGVGKTSLAINLAAALGVLGNAQTLLLDLDMTRGAVAPRLGIESAKNIFGLVAMLIPDYLRAQQSHSSQPVCSLARLTEFTCAAVAGRLSVVPGLPQMHLAGNAEFRADPQRTRALITGIIAAARQKYDFVILDLGPDINNDVHYAGIEAADLVLTVVRPDIADVKSTAQIVPGLRQTFGRPEKFELVINQWNPEAGLRLGEIIQLIGMKKFGEVPYDPTYSRSGNDQKPFILDTKPNPTSDAIVTMAARFFPGVIPTWTKRGGKVDGSVELKAPERRAEPGLGAKLAGLFTGR